MKPAYPRLVNPKNRKNRDFFYTAKRALPHAKPGLPILPKKGSICGLQIFFVGHRAAGTSSSLLSPAAPFRRPLVISPGFK
jgi:hypothetical protein